MSQESQINDKWGENKQPWHKQKRWHSGWVCTDLWVSCRTGTAPFCDLLVHKHTNFCLRTLFLPKNLSLFHSVSPLLTLSLPGNALFNSLFTAGHYFLIVPPLSLSSCSFCRIFHSLFFVYLPSHSPSLCSSAFCSLQFWSKTKGPDVWRIWANRN